MQMLEPDRNQIEIFLDALFRHADRRGYISMRAFAEDGGKAFRISPVSLAGDFKFVIDVAEDDARRAANDPKRVVFCPPVCTFLNGKRAAEEDIAEGVALSVECDQNPRAALETLEQLLGPASLVVRSGGVWTDPDGEIHDKLHLHWRLARPVQGAELTRLKRLRTIAAAIVGADASNKPICHPIRWPGSWHRKAEPRLCEITIANPDVEIDLDAALEALEAAAPHAPTGKANGSGEHGRVEWEAAFRAILSGESYHPTLVPLAASLASWGAPEPVTDNVLRCLLINSTPQDPERLRRRDAELEKLPETVGSAYAKFGKAPDPSKPTTWRFHDNAEPEATPWLIKNILPQTGAGLISGQWGSYKTTVALDIAVSVMTATPLAGRFAVHRPGGVAYFALEGSAGLVSRLTAAARARGFHEALPFAYRADCPALTSPGAVSKLASLIEDAGRELRERFGVDVALVFVDTVVAAAGFAKPGDENDAAMAQKVMAALAGLSRKTGALVVGVDHFGKVAETGTRGSSAKEGHADVVLALLADRELSGTVTNTRLALRKQREGLAGLELPFTPKTTTIGTDADDEPVVRITIEWSAAPKPEASWAKSLQLLRRILMNILAEHGKDIRPYLDGPLVRACPAELVRDEFEKQYVAFGTPRQQSDTRRKAFQRSVSAAQTNNLIMIRDVGGEQLVWLVKPGAAR